jgi:predicted nucleic acid-binding protein
MRVLLDTNVVSELRKASRCHSAVVAWQATVILRDQYLSVVTLLELRQGIALKERNDPVASAHLLNWYQRQVKPAYAERILVVTSNIAERCALLHVPNPRPYRDSLLAATALEHGLALATRNVQDFNDLGLNVINPWDYSLSCSSSSVNRD